MIYSSISARPARCSWPAAIQKALDFLRTSDLAGLPVGRYEIDGDYVYAIIQQQNTGEINEKKAESHYQYIDIQYLISGEERQGYASLFDGAETECFPERDVIYYPQVEQENFICLRPGDFTIYFTNDIHRPNCAVTEGMAIKKAVIKIREEILQNH